LADRGDGRASDRVPVNLEVGSELDQAEDSTDRVAVRLELSNWLQDPKLLQLDSERFEKVECRSFSCEII
jgi:hypothetical protein